MIKEEHFTFRSESGTAQVHGVRWIPNGEVRAVLQIVHGMCEYIERYRGFARYMAQRGILVVGHDHLGHGDTAKGPEEYGYFAEENGYRMLVRDIHRVYRMTKQQYGEVPYILLGHSMGSFLSRLYLCCYGNGLDGAVLCGTGYQPEPALKAALSVCRAQAAVKGWRYTSRLLNWATAGSMNTGFRPYRTPVNWLCRDTAVVDAYLADEKCGFPFTLNGHYNLFLCMYKIIRPEYLGRMPRRLPVLFISGEKDPVGGFGKGVRTVVELFRKTGMQDVQCRLYPNDRHELLNELDRYTVYEDVFAWMQEKGLI